jgi:hypothetical protein
MASPLLRWGLVFLACPLPLDDAQKRDLALLAAQAFCEDVSSVSFDWDGLRGEVRATGRATALGSFVGQAFAAEVHQPDGTSATLRFLVTEPQLRALRPDAPVAEA